MLTSHLPTPESQTSILLSLGNMWDSGYASAVAECSAGIAVSHTLLLAFQKGCLRVLLTACLSMTFSLLLSSIAYVNCEQPKVHSVYL
jgi:hypothetical protein